MTDHYDPRAVLAARPMMLAQWLIIAIPILVNMIDGYDISRARPGCARAREEWNLPDSRLGELLSYSLAGMALGALGVSPVADNRGRRPAILICLVLMSLGMFGAALSQNYWGMALARLVTGIGIGGMTSTAGTVAMEYANAKRREFAPSAVASAYPVGTILGGIVAIAVLDEFGWRGIFWVGGLLSALLFPLAWFYLPESLEFLLSRQPKGRSERRTRSWRGSACHSSPRFPRFRPRPPMAVRCARSSRPRTRPRCCASALRIPSTCFPSISSSIGRRAG